MEHDGRVSDHPMQFLTEAQLAYWEQMPGFLLPSAADRLYRAAADVPLGGRIVELGSFAGKSLVCLAHGAKSRGLESPAGLTAIDLSFHDRWADTVEHFGLGDMVEPIEMSSLDAADGWTAPISLLYIDAHHGLAHARADFVVWEIFVVEGGVIALDDTAGFYPGCSLQVQMALSAGSYEVIDDVGGVTFLRKLAPLFDGIGIAPLQRETAFATIAAVSAWSGAMDPSLSLPNPIRFALTQDLIDTRLHNTLADLDRVRSAAGALHDELGPTIAYLEAIVRLRLGEPEASLRLLETLSDAAPSMLFHYDLDARPMARLRRAQVLDVLGRREEALAQYDALVLDGPLAEVAACAVDGRAQPFALPEPRPGRLLREYVLDSPFDRYRRPRARGGLR